jgi:hypothetical protein
MGRNMPLIWGVDSSHVQPDVVVDSRGRPTRAEGNYDRATAAESLGGSKFAFYNWVVQRFGREPRYWGRYLNNVTADTLDAARRARRARRRLPRARRGDWDVASHLWTNMPRGECNWQLTADSHFMGLGPTGAHTVIWQYGPNCHGERLDLNVATEMGYADMWARSG